MPAPYEQTFRAGGDLCFYADVPALAHIGKRFSELSDGWFGASAPPEELEQWRKLVARLEEVLAAAQQGELTAWPKMQMQLEKEFDDAFTAVRQQVSAPIHEFFETGQMPLPEYVEWFVHAAETLWMQNAGRTGGPDNDAYNARIDRLTERLRTGGYESEMDRRMRAEDPERYAFLAQSAALAMDAFKDPDPQALDKMFEQQMKLYQNSPLFAQGRQMLEQMREQAERFRETDPELYAQQLQSVRQMQRMMEDPAGAMAELQKGLADLEQAHDEDDELPDDATDGPAPAAVPGRLRFNCGRRERPTAEQVALFEGFIAQQEQLRPGIERALRELHKWMDAGESHRFPGDRLLFPKNPDETDVPLQCFTIDHVALEPGGRIVLGLDSQFGHFDEHGCLIAIRHGAVERFGTWEEVYGDEDWDASDVD